MSTETLAPTRRTPVADSHIELDERSRPWIVGTNTKVIEVVMDKVARGWSPEEMHVQHPHLSLAQLHAALAHYYDHSDEIDAEIERDTQEFERLREEWRKTPAARKLREKRNERLQRPAS